MPAALGRKRERQSEQGARGRDRAHDRVPSAATMVMMADDDASDDDDEHEDDDVFHRSAFKKLCPRGCTASQGSARRSKKCAARRPRKGGERRIKEAALDSSGAINDDDRYLLETYPHPKIRAGNVSAPYGYVRQAYPHRMENKSRRSADVGLLLSSSLSSLSLRPPSPPTSRRPLPDTRHELEDCRTSERTNERTKQTNKQTTSGVPPSSLTMPPPPPPLAG
jgi:hypothetical protein